MRRYPHYWWPLKGGRYPSQIGVLVTSSSIGLGASASDRGAGGVGYWCLVVSHASSGIVTKSRRLTGHGAAHIWSTVASLLCRKEQTWILVPRCVDTMTSAGLWKLFLSGAVRLSGRSWEREPATQYGGDSIEDGVCVLNDQPTVIACRMPPRQGKLLLLDTRNFGWRLLHPEMGCHEQAAVYSDALCAVLSELRQNQSVSLRCTAASQAVQALRQTRTCRGLHCHTDGRALRLERDALYGGRCQAFRTGPIKGPVYHVDVRNMYPALCLTLPLPCSLIEVRDEERSARRSERCGDGDWIGHVIIRCRKGRFPCRDQGQVVYRAGTFTTTLAGSEAQSARHVGGIDRVFSYARYDCRPVLGDFYRHWLDRLHTARLQGHTLVCDWIKAMMNGLPGRFAQVGRYWMPSTPRADHGPYAEWIDVLPDGSEARYRNIAWHTQVEEKHGETYWSMPAVAAFIMAAGRVQLARYIATAGRNATHYVDTDSLIVSERGYHSLVDSGMVKDGEPGHLRLLGRHDRCLIHGIRHYELDDEIICAGIPRGQIKAGETRDEYWRRPDAKTNLSVLSRIGRSHQAVPL